MSPSSDNFNKDELNAPAWLNQEFFTDVLKKSETTENIHVTNIKISPATAKGDHYASVMFRAVVDYRKNGEERTKSMVLKTMPELEGMKKDLLADSYLFETEIGIYTQVIPKFESILREVGDDTVLGPPCIYHTLSPKKVIIFEDIVPMGYTTLRGRQVTLEEAKAAYTKIAKWHAIGYKLNFDEPEVFGIYRHGIMNMTSFTENEAYTNGILDFIEMLGQHDDLIQYKKYFEPLKDFVLLGSIAAFSEYHESPHSKAIYGLCHGDFHFKNIMFKHCGKSGALENIMLLDYQLSYMGPIVNDLMYSKIMLINSDQRQNHWDELLSHYHSIFEDTLKKIGFNDEIPKLLQFKAELMRLKIFELFLITTFLPIWESFVGGTVDPDDLLSSSGARKKLYKSQNYINEIKFLLRNYLHQGYFEK